MTQPGPFEVHKVTAFMPVSQEMLDDARGVQDAMEDLLFGRKKWRRHFRQFRWDLRLAWSHLRHHTCPLECHHDHDLDEGDW